MQRSRPSLPNPINVTKPELPDLEKFLPYLEKIWDNRILTNNGPFHQILEQQLCEYLGVNFISLFSSGTMALMAAAKVLGLSGEVITTPYSFVATSHALKWLGIKPVFVDIDPHTLNIDPSRIADVISPQTTAIMPIHCYGHPCATDEIRTIAKRNDLKVVYDAAHVFGERCKGASLLNQGDLSALSFHATKIFNVFEGGALVCHDADTKQQIDLIKNFGIADEVSVESCGVNGKMSEFNAALGLLQLQSIDDTLSQRQRVNVRYLQALENTKGIICVNASRGRNGGVAYFPILVTPDYAIDRDSLHTKLLDNGVYARRYFYPLISDHPMYCDLPSAAPQNLPVAHQTASQVICLPMYPSLRDEEIDYVSAIIRG